MSIVSYDVEVLNVNKKLRDTVANTLAIYNSALNYVCNVVKERFNEIKELNLQYQKQYIEKLIHNTKNNKAEYDFDALFYKLPCYLRRDIQARAVGHISSFKSNLDNYNKEKYEKISNGKKFKKKEPTLGNCNVLPTFYKGSMFTEITNNRINLKLFVDNTWKFISFKLKPRDLKYINQINGKRYNPTIRIVGKKIFVRFSFEVETLKLSDKKINDQIICGVDLGINNAATLSIMDAKGTIKGRHFVHTCDIDLLNHLLNKKKKIQRNSGNYKYLGKLHIVNKINSLNDNIVNYTCSEIIKICLSYDVDVIVFENLRHKFKKGKKSFREKFHHWRKRSIYNKATAIAHRNGMRISTVNPAGTSKYAFDGSGEVKRDNTNYYICTFASGKRYNSDLSASYNIAARYIVRSIIKPLDENSRLDLETKASLSLSGTKVTYHTLMELLKVATV